MKCLTDLQRSNKREVMTAAAILMCMCFGLIAVTILVSIPAHAQSSLVLYDDFHTRLLDPTKWFGAEPGAAVGLEAVRESPNRHLHLAYRSYGATGSDSGTQAGFFSLFFTNPAAITAIQATMQVNKVQSTGCSTPNSDITTARAEIHGRFFNTGTPVAGSSLGDAVAHVQISQYSNESVLRVLADTFQCSDPGCSQGSPLGVGEVDLGTIGLGTSTTLQMQWDQPNHQFIFRRDNQSPVFVPYTQSDTAPPSLQFKTLDINNFVANCTATPRPVGFVDVFYDDILVNAGAAP